MSVIASIKKTFIEGAKGRLFSLKENADVPKLVAEYQATIDGIVPGLWVLPSMSETLTLLCALKISGRVWFDECVSRTHALLESLTEVFRFHKVCYESDDLTKFFGKYLLASLSDLSEEFFKYQTNWVACRLLRQGEFPERPILLPLSEKDGFLLESCHRVLFHKLWNYNRRCSLAYDLIMCKRGAAPVSVLKRLKALGKHAANLSRKPEPEVPGSDLSKVLDRITTLIPEIYGGRWDSQFIYPEEPIRAPSTSSTYTHNRSELGGLKPIKELIKLAPCDHCTLASPIYNILDCGCARWLVGETSQVPNPEHDFPFHWDGVVPSHHEETPFLRVPYGADERRVQGDKSHVLSSVTDEDFKSTVHIVLEPMKVRTITAGSAKLNFLGMYWQKFLHAKVGSFPVFEFTHSPASFAKMRAAIGDLLFGELLVSGDYEAATDNLNPLATRQTWAELCEYLVPRYYLDESGRAVMLDLETMRTEYDIIYETGLKMLVGQRLEYGPAVEKLLGALKTLPNWEWLQANFGIRSSVDQDYGQLMGCILSFFILCIINFGTYVCAYEEVHNVKLTGQALRDLPCRINGDDIAFRGTPAHIAAWKRFALAVGLKPSLGKNFVSDEFIMINSEMYIYSDSYECHIGDGYGYMDLETRQLNEGSAFQPYKYMVKFAPYLNMGLLKGQGRVQEDTRVDQKFLNGCETYKSVGARSQAMIRGYSKKKASEIMDRFITYNLTTLKTTKRSWFIPEELGGLGLPCENGMYSSSGLVVAAYLDRLMPDQYAAWMSQIKTAELNPPDYVKKSLELTGSIQRFFAKESEWMSPEEAKEHELPMITGLTFLVEEYRPVEKKDRQVSAEAAWERLYHEAIRSGVKRKTPEQIQEIWANKGNGQVRTYRIPCNLKHQLLSCVPRFSSGFLSKDWQHPRENTASHSV